MRPKSPEMFSLILLLSYVQISADMGWIEGGEHKAQKRNVS